MYVVCFLFVFQLREWLAFLRCLTTGCFFSSEWLCRDKNTAIERIRPWRQCDRAIKSMEIDTKVSPLQIKSDKGYNDVFSRASPREFVFWGCFRVLGKQGEQSSLKGKGALWSRCINEGMTKKREAKKPKSQKARTGDDSDLKKRWGGRDDRG